MSDVAESVVATARRMAAERLVVGTAGNVSGRQPGGTVCITPSSTPYDELTVDNLAVVEPDGAVVSGKPSTEKAMHLACYRAFDEVGGVVHCHPLYSSMFAVARRTIPAVIEEVIVYVGGDVPVADYRTTGTDDLAAEVVRHLGDRGAVLMANHGLLCVGKSPEDALHTAMVVEHTAHIVWGAAALGHVEALPAKVAADFGGIYGYLRSNWT